MTGALRLAGAGCVAVLGAGGLAGCARKESFQNPDITGADYARDFHLTGADGKSYSIESFRGKLVVVFFGYTQCPDVCPTTMLEIAQALKQLGDDAKKVQVVFITVDPERDTPAVLGQYVPAFDPSFLGLYGNEEQTRATAKEFKVFYQKAKSASGGSYTVDHSAGTFVFDTQGRIRLYARYGQGPAPLAHDLKLLLSQGA